MPIDSAAIGLANRFYVKFETSDHDLGTWASVTGLEVKWEECEYRSGESGNQTWIFPGRNVYTNVKLTRAACEDTNKTKKWLTDTSFNYQGDILTIQLFDAGMKPVVEWTVTDVLPVKWSISGFEASGSKVATETLEFSHQGFLDDAVR